MNQFQLILLLLLTKTHIPKSVVDYLSGLKATTCSFNFIPFKKIPGLSRLVESLDYELKMKELDHFGLFSGSTFANNLSLVCIVALLVGVHLVFLLVFRMLRPKREAGTKCAKVLDKVFELFAFTIYIRLLLRRTSSCCWQAFRS